MLIGLHLRDFALAERVDLDLSRGYTVITGETGAGKSVLIQALAFALGAPADPEMIRPGADRAEVEAVFDFSGASIEQALSRRLSEADVDFDGSLIVRRSVGRPQPDAQRLSLRLRINDRAATLGLLRDLAPLIADIHGQREQLSLLRPAEQLTMLDRFAGVDHLREALGVMVRRLHTLDRQVEQITMSERERIRRIALLRHEAAEIVAADLQPAEDELLQLEHRRLVNAQQLALDTETARAALDGEAIDEALGAIRRIMQTDPSAQPIVDSVEIAVEQIAESARALRAYADELEIDPSRLTVVESRIALLSEMKRRWGDNVAEIIAYAEQAESEAASLEQQAADAESLRQEADQLAADLAYAAADLSGRRREAAKRFGEAIKLECADLQLNQARVEFEFAAMPPTGASRQLTVNDQPVGFDASGIDRVQLLVSFNIESPPRPIQRIASGGETARLTLAIKAVLGERDAVPIMVFDEVDVGLGGRSGSMIGERLARLGVRRQVIGITHLPQVAAYASRHITVAKSADIARTTVDVRVLTDDERVAELAEMLGGLTDATRISATELLHTAIAT